MSEADRKVVPYRGAAKGACPTCRKPAAAQYRPFCSKRCADLDLHRWLSDGYRVPTDEQPQDDSTESPEPDPDEG